MNEQRISELLEVADAGVTAPGEVASGLAEQAIRRARRRSTVKRVGLLVHAGGAVVLIALWLAPDFTHQSTTITPPAPVASVADESADDIARDRELAELRARIVMQEAVIEALLAREHVESAPIVLAGDPLDAVRAQADLAAKRLVLAANRMEYNLGTNDQSDRLYADVLTNFPDSAWAGIARKRIDQHESNNEPRSAVTCEKSIT